MLFSVLVTAYNVEAYIEECLESILKQDFSDYEIVIVDDGSTDGTAAICDSYVKRFENVKVFHWENHGLILARRKAIELATGDYLLFLDADDAHIGGSLKALQSIVTRRKPDLVLFRFRFFYENGKEADSTNFGIRVYNENDREQLFFDFISNYEYNHLCCKLIKKDLISKDQFDYQSLSRIRLGEDLLQSIPLFTNAKTTCLTDLVLYRYRVTGSSMSHGFNPQHIDDIETVYQLLFSTIRDRFSSQSRCMKEARNQLDIKLASLLRSVWSSTLSYADCIEVSKKISLLYSKNQAEKHPNRLVIQNRLLMFFARHNFWKIAAAYTLVLNNIR